MFIYGVFCIIQSVKSKILFTESSDFNYFALLLFIFLNICEHSCGKRIIHIQVVFKITSAFK